MLPDEPQKAIEYVLAFLPGFAALGLAGYIADLRFDPFEFVYVAILLSLVNYAVARGIVALLTLRSTRADAPRRRLAASAGTMVLALGLSVGLGGLLAYGYQEDIVLEAAAGLGFDKVKSGKPLNIVMHDFRNCTMINSDGRFANPADAPKARPYLRIYSNSGIFEGFPAWYPTRGEPNEFYLSPACQLVRERDESASLFKYEKVAGPGVFLPASAIAVIEFIDLTESDCYREFFPKEDPTDQDCQTLLFDRAD